MTPPGEFRVRYTAGARDDLLRLTEHLIARAETAEQLDAVQQAIDAIRAAVEQRLSKSPFVYRKAANSPFLRELLIPFGASGYVALYEIAAEREVHVLAVRHQLEEDYH